MPKRIMAIIPRTRVATVSFRIFARCWLRQLASGRKPKPDHHGYKAAQFLTHVIAFDIKGVICHFSQVVVILATATSHLQSFRAI